MSLSFRLLLLLGIAPLSFAQYAGPAILSRGEAPGAVSLPSIQFRPFLDVSGVYSTGLEGVVLSGSGQLANHAAEGMRLSFGISGHHRWHHSDVSVDYRGGLDHYFRQTYYDGMSHSLLLSLRHELSRNMVVSLSESAGMFTRDFGLLGIPNAAINDPATTYVPTTDYFDNRTIYFTTSGSLVYRKTARLSLSMGGVSLINKRRSDALHSANGVVAYGDLQYRFTRHSTIGAAYQYNHYTYSQTVGGADVHSGSGVYSLALNARTEFSAYAGAARVEVKNLITTATDPAIAALLGVSETTQVSYTQRWTPSFGARISRRIPHAILFATASRGITPGNGLFLTSEMTSFSAGYTYLGLRRWSASANASYYYSNALTGLTGSYAAGSGGVRVARNLGRALHFTAAYTVRQYDSARYSNYQRWVYEATAGIAYSPGEMPLRVW